MESFATIVGLLGQYRAERGAQAQLEYNDFLAWLVEENHAETKSLLELNVNATIGIKALLHQNHEVFKQKLDKIDAAITAFASTIEGFDAIAKGLSPKSALSEQAISILEQFQKSGATKILEVEMMEGTEYIFIESSENVEISEPRFAEDDLKTLVEFGLLRHDQNSNGDNIYVFTRMASRLVSGKSS